MPKLYSYVVDHDRSHAPNPYFRVCTLCRCMFRKKKKGRKNIVELAEPGNWVIGTGGADLRKSAGHGKLVYAMRVSEKLTRGEYYRDSRFQKKKPVRNGSYEQAMGDNKRPKSAFERNEQFVLISSHFFYFGRNASCFPKTRFPHLEKTGRRFRRNFDEDYIARFVKWLETETGYKPGRNGEPCMKDLELSSKRRDKQSCKPSC